jgi:UDP-N-acetylglucosamine diphosphorylase/glucosamine-1-phosphate N-acetyltransferase
VKGRLYVWDADADLPRFHPYSQSRPLGELRYGARLLRERWEDATGLAAAGHLTSSHLRDFTEPAAPPAVAAAAGPCVVGRSSFVPQPGSGLAGDGPLRFTTPDGTTVGGIVPAGATWSEAAAAGWPAQVLPGKLLTGAWQIIADLPGTLRSDLERLLLAGEASVIPRGATVLGDPALVMARDAMVEPHVVFDVRSGPIAIEAGVEVRTFTRLQGPLWVGRDSRLVGGQLRESAIGPRCVVHGEVSHSVFLGYSNKSHDGFLGHSLVGRWVNLGAGTVTSNLKNTYGPVRLDLGTERVETGMTFLGSLLGDHVKTAIGTMFPTGCAVGTGANIFGARRPAGPVRAFAWGTDEPDRVLACRMFLQTAARVLPRRDIAVDESTKNWLRAVWEHATGQQCD